MKTTLIEYTGMGRYPWAAADLLIFTKSTRLKMTADGLAAIAAWPTSKKEEELAYMANTIRSSWEFIDYIFLLEDVTLAFTQQLLRSRHASFAQQTMQILQVDATNVEPPRGDWYISSDEDAENSDFTRLERTVMWDNCITYIGETYSELIRLGATVEQARGLLPRNIRTNIVVKMNLRTLTEVLHSRISPRNLGEYRDVAVAMRDAILAAHPWAAVFVEQTKDKVIADLEREIAEAGIGGPQEGGTRGARMYKLVDQLRRS